MKRILLNVISVDFSSKNKRAREDNSIGKFIILTVIDSSPRRGKGLLWKMEKRIFLPFSNSTAITECERFHSNQIFRFAVENCQNRSDAQRKMIQFSRQETWRIEIDFFLRAGRNVCDWINGHNWATLLDGYLSIESAEEEIIREK